MEGKVAPRKGKKGKGKKHKAEDHKDKEETPEELPSKSRKAKAQAKPKPKTTPRAKTKTTKKASKRKAGSAETDTENEKDSDEDGSATGAKKAKKTALPGFPLAFARRYRPEGDKPALHWEKKFVAFNKTVHKILGNQKLKSKIEATCI